jgi:hypothetical protein
MSSFTVRKALLLEHIQRCSRCDPLKIFFTSKCSYVLFCNPTNKTETGTANRWGTTIANHMDQSLWWADQKHWEAVRSYLLHSFMQVHSAAARHTSHGTLRNYAEPKPFFWVKPIHVGFSSSVFSVQDHILSTLEMLVGHHTLDLRLHP